MVAKDEKSRDPAYTEMRRLIDQSETLSDPDDVPLDDVGPGRSGISLDQVMAEGDAAGARESVDAGGPGTGKRDPRIDKGAREGIALMRGRRPRSNSGEVQQTTLRCPHCFDELGKAAPKMLMVEGAKQAHCPNCGKTYP